MLGIFNPEYSPVNIFTPCLISRQIVPNIQQVTRFPIIHPLGGYDFQTLLQFLLCLCPILFTLTLLTTFLKVNLVRPLGNVFESRLGNRNRLGTRNVMCLLGNWHLGCCDLSRSCHLRPYRFICGCLHQNILSFGILSLPMGQVQVPTSPGQTVWLSLI
jgi:hypothetical protein